MSIFLPNPSVASSEGASAPASICPQQGERLLDSALPKHIALIMDGNRRWAKQRSLPATSGHSEGVAALMRTVEAAAGMGVRYLTVFAFSTENWRRSSGEVAQLFELMEEAICEQSQRMQKEQISLGVIGDISKLPLTLQQSLNRVIQQTSGGERLRLTLAINYGGRHELVRAIQKLAADVAAQRLNVSDIDESCVSGFLDTAALPDPELIIRTSGECRLSNFLLWQAQYSEIITMDVLWPDFNGHYLAQAIDCYRGRQRRLGK